MRHFTALLILFVFIQIRVAQGATIGAYADPAGRIQEECVTAREITEIYLVATDLFDGSVEGLDYIEVFMTFPQDGGLTILSREILVDGFFLEDTSGFGIFVVGNLESCPTTSTLPLARMTVIGEFPLEDAIEVELEGFGVDTMPRHSGCEGDDVVEFDLAPPLRLLPAESCCPTIDQDFALQFGWLDFPPFEATIDWVYTPARPDDTLERTSCGETSVHGFRGTVRVDPQEMAWSRVVEPFGFLEVYDLTETVVEPGVVSLEFRDPTSLEGVGDTPLLEGHTVTLAFEPLDFGTELEVEVVDVEVCVNTIGVDDDVPCTWQATSTPDLRGVIRADLSDRASSFGTLKARFRTEDD